MSEDLLHHWERLGYPPKYVFEFEGGLSYCYDVRQERINERDYVTLIAATIFFERDDRIQPFTTYSLPAHLIKRIELFKPRPRGSLADLMANLRKTLFQEVGREK